jgi:hypothetical protein
VNGGRVGVMWAKSRLAASYPRRYVSATRNPLKCKPMTETPPDRLSNDPNSPYFDADALQRGVGIRFKGVEKTNVEEYCISEGWIRVTAGTAKDRAGNPMTIKLSGPVEAYFRDSP